jgi:hypothetical protein
VTSCGSFFLCCFSTNEGFVDHGRCCRHLCRSSLISSNVLSENFNHSTIERFYL